MIESISAIHARAPTKCHELSGSTARWGLRSCMAGKSSSTSFRAGTSYLNIIAQPAERRLIAPWRTVDGRADCKRRSSEAHIGQEQGASRPSFGSLKVARRGLVGYIEEVEYPQLGRRCNLRYSLHFPITQECPLHLASSGMEHFNGEGGL